MYQHLHRWRALALVASALYVAIGLTFSSVPMFADVTSSRTMWRKVAFLLSAIVYLAHLVVERRTRGPARTASLHVATGVALGGFGLAVAANVHSFSLPSANKLLLTSALILWPILTGVPAFVVALGLTTLGSQRGKSADMA